VQHRAAGTDSAKAMCNDKDAAHENVATARIGGRKGADEQPDAFRSQAQEGAGDETSASRQAETAYISTEGWSADDDGGVDSTSVGVWSEKAGGASGKTVTMRSTEKVAHTAHGSKRVPKSGPNAPPVRSSLARGLTNTGNTCFLNASLQCLGGVQELRETRARHLRQRRTFQYRLFECISQLQFRPSPYYTPRPLLDTLPWVVDQFQTRQQADAHEILVLLLGKMDQGGPREVFYGSTQTVLTCSTCPHSSIRQATTAQLSLNLEPSKNSTINQCRKAFFNPASALDEYQCDCCGRVGTSTLFPPISTPLTMSMVHLKRLGIGGK